MRKVFLILALLLTIGAAFLVHSLRPIAAAGSAYAAKALCSGVFVTGLNPDRVAAEEYESLDDAFKRLSRRVDVPAKVVETSMLGLGKAKAQFDPITGCSLFQSDQFPKRDVNVQRGQFTPLPTSNLDPSIDQSLLAEALETGFADSSEGMPKTTRAIVVIKNGAVVAERYAEGIGPDTPLKGWSMNKTITGLIIGSFIDRGELKLDGPAPVKAWSGDDDPRRAISIRYLMQMRSGLDFDESYSDMTSDAIKMLFLSPSASDYAVTSGIAHEPGTKFYYSSGTSNILAAIAADLAEAKGQSITDYMWDTLLTPAGVTTAYLELDQDGDFVGSSYGYMGAHDWARLGLLMLRRGQGPDGQQIITPEWIQFMTEPNGVSDGAYGGQTWLNAGAATGSDWSFKEVPPDMFYFSGHDGQHVVVIPSKDMVIVRLGESIYRNSSRDLAELMTKILDAVDP